MKKFIPIFILLLNIVNGQDRFAKKGKTVSAQKDGVELLDDNETWSVPVGIVAMLLGCSMIYSIMFCTGYFIYGNLRLAFPLLALAIVSGYLLIKIWGKIKVNVL